MKLLIFMWGGLVSALWAAFCTDNVPKPAVQAVTNALTLCDHIINHRHSFIQCFVVKCCFKQAFDRDELEERFFFNVTPRFASSKIRLLVPTSKSQLGTRHSKSHRQIPLFPTKYSSEFAKRLSIFGDIVKNCQAGCQQVVNENLSTTQSGFRQYQANGYFST